MLAGVPTALLNYPSWAIEVSVEQAQVYVFKLSLHWFLVKAAFTDWPIEVFIEQKLLTSTTWKDLDGGTSSASVANPNTRLIFRWVERRLVNYRKLLLQGESFPHCGIMHLHEASVYCSVWAEKTLGARLSYSFKCSLALSLGCPLLPPCLFGFRNPLRFAPKAAALSYIYTLKKFHSWSRGEIMSLKKTMSLRLMFSSHFRLVPHSPL